MKRGSANGILLPAVVVVILAIAAVLIYLRRQHDAQQAALEAEYTRLNGWHDPAKHAFDLMVPALEKLDNYDWKHAKNTDEIDAAVRVITEETDAMRKSSGPQGAGYAMPKRVDRLFSDYMRIANSMKLPFQLNQPDKRARLAAEVFSQMPEAQHHKFTTRAEFDTWKKPLVDKVIRLDDATLKKMFEKSREVESDIEYAHESGRDDLERVFRIPPIVPPGLERKDAGKWESSQP